MLHCTLEHDIRLERSANYLFSAEVQIQNVKIEQAGGQFGFILSAGDSHTTADLTGSSNGWKTISLPFTTKAKLEPTRLKIQLGGNASVASGRVRLRNIQVRKIGYPETPVATK